MYIAMYKILKPYTLARFEPAIFCSVDGDDDHYTRAPTYIFFKTTILVTLAE
jgi:hypothetical protein